MMIPYWTFDADIDHYNVRYKKPSDSDWKHFTSLKLSEREFTVSGSRATFMMTGLSDNTEYEWQMRAKCANGGAANEYEDGQGPNFFTGSSENNNGGGSTCSAPVPNNRAVGNVGKNSAEVHWNFNADIDHYNVRYKKPL